MSPGAGAAKDDGEQAGDAEPEVAGEQGRGHEPGGPGAPDRRAGDVVCRKPPRQEQKAHAHHPCGDEPVDVDVGVRRSLFGLVWFRLVWAVDAKQSE